MEKRTYDGLTLAVGLFFTGLGGVIFVDTVGILELGALFYVFPDTAPWPVRAFLLQEQNAALLALVLVGSGVSQLWQCWGAHVSLRYRIISGWVAWACLVDLLAHRLLAVTLERSVPWWAIIALGALIVAMTVRRITDMRAT